MNVLDIETNLAALGAMLVELEVRRLVYFLMIGGAFMLTQIGNRRSTDDVDGMLLNVSYESQIYLRWKNAVRFVAHDYHIHPAWLSDTIADFLRLCGPLPRTKRWKTFDVLQVVVPDERYILALKLLAGREKDDEDIAVLCQRLNIRTRQQAQHLLDQVVTNRDLQLQQHVPQTLQLYFP